MYIYASIFLYTAVFSILESLGIERSIKTFGAVSAFFILFFIAGLRYETGVDWPEYYKMMDHANPLFTFAKDIASGYYSHDIDKGYVLLSSIVKTFGGGIQTIYFIVSFFTLITLIKNLQYYTPNIALGILLYYSTIFFLLDMSGMRQCISLSFFIISLKYIAQRNFLKFFVVILIGASFHWSAYFTIPFYFLLTRTYSNRSAIIFMAFQLFIFFFKVRWLRSVLQLALPLLPNGKFFQKIFIYTNAVATATPREMNLTTYINIFYIVSIFAILIVNRKRISTVVNNFNVFFNLFLFNSFFYLCTSELLDISYRMQIYFSISIIFILSALPYIFKERISKAFVTICVIFYCVSYSKSYIFHNETTIAYYPYQNYMISKMFNIKSNGKERIDQHRRTHVKEGFIAD